jgi:hypothetical protein
MPPTIDEAITLPSRTPNVARVRGQGRRNGNVVHLSESDDDIAVEGFKPLLPEGKWFEARFDGHATAVIFNTGKVFWEFTITEPGEWFEQKVFRAFRVRKLIGRPGNGGKFILAASSDMYDTLRRLLDVKLRTDRITMRPLRHMLFRIRMRTVTKNHRQELLADHMQYSVVDAIERGE